MHEVRERRNGDGRSGGEDEERERKAAKKAEVCVVEGERAKK
jgi:hypothetical protein